MPGPLDIVGDVHGELAALESLLERLGYSPEGVHPAGRRLVFVGDLCDRGPDSPGVLFKVRDLSAAGLAQSVLGNHELNLLCESRKPGNHWFFGEESDPTHPQRGPSRALAEEQRAEARQFMATLPLALERCDLRIVHAAWHSASIEHVRQLEEGPHWAYRRAMDALLSTEEGAQLQAAAKQARRALKSLLHDPCTKWLVEHAEHIDALARYDQACQLSNPVRLITSGTEAICTPWYGGGRWRFVARTRWWDTYQETPVVFGHYWRWCDAGAQAHYFRGESPLFETETPAHMPPNARAFCVDFSVGARYKERHANRSAPFHGRLAALRWPERTVVFDADAAPALARD